jgi:hypothetical protein
MSRARAALLLAVALAGCGEAPTVVRLRVVTAPTLSIDGLDVTIGEDRQTSAMAEELELRVPGSWAGLPLPIVVDGLDGAAVVASGSTLVTPVAGEAVDATVALYDARCERRCEIDAERCEGDGVVRCGFGADGCPTWGEASPCPTDAPFCSDGVCDDDCDDECDAGDTECDGEAAERTCGQADGDACRDWTPSTACGEDEACAAEACAPAHVLTVAIAGNGQVASDPAGIACGSACSERFVDGTVVTLTPTPAEGETFEGWDGADCSGIDPCVVTIAETRTVTARFSGGCDDDCQPQTIAREEAEPDAIALDATHVYWTNADDEDGAVRRQAKAGGAIETVASTAYPARGLTVDATPVYWTTQWHNGVVARRATSGGAAETIVADSNGSQVVAVDATHAYWYAGVGGTTGIWRAPRAGGTPELFAADEDGQVYAIALDDDHAYWAHSDGFIRRRAKSGAGATEDLATAQHRPGTLALDATHVYWTVYGFPGAVRRRAKAGGAVTDVAAEQWGADGLALDATHVYWTADYDVRRRPKAGGAIEVLGTTTGSPPGNLAVDADHVYWTTGLHGAVQRRAFACACE